MYNWQYNFAAPAKPQKPTKVQVKKGLQDGTYILIRHKIKKTSKNHQDVVKKQKDATNNYVHIDYIWWKMQ